jgi:hypothetical protein
MPTYRDFYFIAFEQYDHIWKTQTIMLWSKFKLTVIYRNNHCFLDDYSNFPYPFISFNLIIPRVKSEQLLHKANIF